MPTFKSCQYRMQTTWEEVYGLVKEWLENSDEEFEDKYLEFLYLMKKEDSDPDFKKALEFILNIMDLLRERL